MDSIVVRHVVDGIGVLIKHIQSPVAIQTLQDGTRMTAAAKGNVHIDSRRLYIQCLDTFVEHHRLMVKNVHLADQSFLIVNNNVAQKILRHLREVVRARAGGVVSLGIPDLNLVVETYYKYVVLQSRVGEQPLWDEETVGGVERYFGSVLVKLAEEDVMLTVEGIQFPLHHIYPLLPTLLGVYCKAFFEDVLLDNKSAQGILAHLLNEGRREKETSLCVKFDLKISSKNAHIQ